MPGRGEGTLSRPFVCRAGGPETDAKLRRLRPAMTPGAALTSGTVTWRDGQSPQTAHYEL